MKIKDTNADKIKQNTNRNKNRNKNNGKIQWK